MRTLCTILAVTSLATPSIAGPVDDPAFSWWKPSNRERAEHVETILQRTIDPASLRQYHTDFASEPHVAGTEGDLNLARKLAGMFESFGLDVEMHEIWVYLAYPQEAAVEVVSPDARLSLPVKERALDGDTYTGDDRLDIGWNAYSASGDVTGEVVYANYGTKEDFEKLEELGVDVAGKVVIARYGGNYRGYKAKFAEEHGAAGLIIFTDPEDSGYVKGLTYPEGGYANDSFIQRGSIMTSDVEGDPLTPFAPATKDAERIDPADAGLPNIPVQPVGPAAAREILSLMRGERVPDNWQGGLPLAYRVTGGPDLQVRVSVKQDRRVTKTYNVVGTLSGTDHPEEKVIIGCHHDAWGFGASDPTAGLICVVESARCFGELAKQGIRPKRSILFAAWAAEEYGLIGSSEWVEAHHADLSANAVAYINADMAAMGPKFRCSSAPSLKKVIAATASRVTHPIDTERTVLDRWLERSTDKLLPSEPGFGDLGGGSDHVGFYCHLAIPSCGMAAGGSRGTAYHSNYDTLAWYRQIVGDDYLSGELVTSMVNGTAWRLADADLLPLDLVRYGVDLRRHLRNLTKRAKQLDVLDTDSDVAVEVFRLDATGARFQRLTGETFERLHEAIDNDALTDEELARINELLLRAEREWLIEGGIPGRTWFRSLYAATDEDSGYAQWLLPGLRHAIEHRSVEDLRARERLYLDVMDRLADIVQEIDDIVE